jgi:hypothetical protein
MSRADFPSRPKIRLVMKSTRCLLCGVSNTKTQEFIFLGVRQSELEYLLHVAPSSGMCGACNHLPCEYS